MKTRKIIALVLLLGMAAGILSGCHGTLDQNASKEGYISEIPLYLDETKKIELNFWAKNDTNKVQTAVYMDAIEEFQKLYPNITVNIRLYADYGRIFNDVITNIGTNTTPNICITYPDHIATYLTGDGVMLPLDDWMTDPHRLIPDLWPSDGLIPISLLASLLFSLRQSFLRVTVLLVNLWNSSHQFRAPSRIILYFLPPISSADDSILRLFVPSDFSDIEPSLVIPAGLFPEYSSLLIAHAEANLLSMPHP